MIELEFNLIQDILLIGVEVTFVVAVVGLTSFVKGVVAACSAFLGVILVLLLVPVPATYRQKNTQKG